MAEAQLVIYKLVKLFVLFNMMMLGFSTYCFAKLTLTTQSTNLFVLLIKNDYPSSPVFASFEQETSKSDEQRKSSEKQLEKLPR